MYQKIRDFYRFYDTKFQQGGYSKIQLEKYIELGEEVLHFNQQEFKKIINEYDKVKKELISLYIRKFQIEDLNSLTFSQKAQKLSSIKEMLQEQEEKREKWYSLFKSKKKEIKTLHSILNKMFGKEYLPYSPLRDEIRKNTPILSPTKTNPLEEVYFMINRDNGLIKIGFSRDPKVRLTSIKSEQLTKNIDILLTIPCAFQAKELEHLFHSLLHKYRKKGEWFDITEKGVSYITNGENLPSDFAECIWKILRQHEGLEELKKQGVANATS